METWSFSPEEDDGFGLPPGILRPSHLTTKATSEWGFMNNQSSVSRRSHDETLGQGIVEKAISDGPIDGLLDNVISDGQAVASKSSSTNTSFREHESSSKDSSSIIDSNAQESSFVDLKLGIFSNYGDPKSMVTKVGAFVSCAPTKRVRSTSSNSSQTQICQVHGCNMDLSSSKPYHRKHRVCETHSKTTKVVVNGKTQRFCQQCSRFHFLPEFDGAKRSCRRRLAGHNERRRKPQIDNYTQRIGQSPQSYFGGKYHGSRTLFFRRNIFPLNASSNEEHNHKKQTLVTPVLPSCGKELTFESSNIPKSTLSRSSYQHDGESEVNALPAQRANVGLYGNSSSGCALYLLSNQLEESSPYPSQNSITQRLPFLNSYHSQQFEAPIHDKILGLESQSFADVASSSLSLAGLKAIANNDVGLHNLCDYNTTNVGDNSGGILHTSQFIGSTNLVSHQNMNDTDVLLP